MRNKFKFLSNKPNIFFIIVIVTFLLSLGGLNYIYASLIDNDNRTNDFQVGAVKGEITEKFDPPTKDNPIKPGDSYQKEVKISNTGNLPFFVRVLVIPEIQSADGTLLPSEINKEILVNINSDWKLGEDGFYYYLKTVNKDETTTALFSSVTLNSNLASNKEISYEQATMFLNIKSETISSTGNNYRQAWWQGNIPTEENLNQIDEELQQTKGEN